MEENWREQNQNRRKNVNLRPTERPPAEINWKDPKQTGNHEEKLALGTGDLCNWNGHRGTGDLYNLNDKRDQEEGNMVNEPEGFQNLGCTCYLNAVLQCLRFSPDFRQLISRNQVEPNSVVGTLQKAFDKPTTIDEFVENLQRSAGIQLLKMSDPGQFLFYELFPQLEDELGKAALSPFCFRMRDSPEEEDYCLPFIGFSLHNNEKLSDIINRNQNYLDITYFPDVAALRFNTSGTYSGIIDEKVNLGLLKGDNIEYSLFGMVVNFHRSHFVAIVKTEEQTWHRLDDDKKSKVGQHFQLLLGHNDSPLLLFYRREPDRSPN